MILETERGTDWALRREQHALLISELGILDSFERARRQFLREGYRVTRVIITHEEEHELLERLPESDSYVFMDRPPLGQGRTLHGVPVVVAEPLTLDHLREVRRRFGQAGPPTAMSFTRLSEHGLITWGEATRVMRLYGIDPCSSGNPEPSRACRACGQTSEHFFTSQRDQSVLCEGCFGAREQKQLAKQVTKSKHPLDAWMG